MIMNRKFKVDSPCIFYIIGETIARNKAMVKATLNDLLLFNEEWIKSGYKKY